MLVTPLKIPLRGDQIIDIILFYLNSPGDPTVFGNLPLCQEMLDAVSNSLESGKFNGYGPAIGRFASNKE